MPSTTPRAVTFDFGHTLCDLDTGMLSRRLGERGLSVGEASLEAAVSGAWSAYNAAILAGFGGHPWKIMMQRLLSLAGVTLGDVGGAVDWLWTEQPQKNLWRRPIPGMIEIVDDLRRASVKVGVISNSEGRLAELVEEVGWSGRFQVIADSGKLGLSKPDAPIFHFTAAALGVRPEEVVHIGDALVADVQGAVRAGMLAIWFRGRAGEEAPPGARIAADAEEVRAALAAWGLLPQATG